jgi:transposase
MEFEFFIGIDVSKNKLDLSVQQGKCFLYHQEIANEPSAINAFLKELAKRPGFLLAKAVFCMEHTGIYNNHLLYCLHKKKASIWLEAAIQIKKSMGATRGKNDKVDSERIASYAYKNRDDVRLWEPKREAVQQLAYLSATRSRLITYRKALKTPQKESSRFIKKDIINMSANSCSSTLKGIAADLAKVEKAISSIITADAELKRLFSLITSVKGIGGVTAVHILTTTNEFKDIREAKKYACYSGAAPFVEESGILKGKGRVSHMANKKIKTLLHMAALVAIRYNPELKHYYKRKTEVEKKNKMSVINAVRNKLILRIFACVNQNRKYEINYVKSVA